MGLIEEIKATPSTCDIIHNGSVLREIYHNNSLIWKRTYPFQITSTLDHDRQSRNYYVALNGQEITSIEIETSCNMVLHSSNIDGTYITHEVWDTKRINWTGRIVGNTFVLDAACSRDGWRPDKYTFFQTFKLNGQDVTWAPGV